MIDENKLDEILAQKGIKISNASNDWYSQLDRNKPVPSKERNILQKTAGFVLDPLTKLATESGNLVGKGIVRGVEQFQSPEHKAITEQRLQNVLNNPSQVPGIGTEVKGLNNVTARDVAGQVLETGAMFAPGVSKGASLAAKVGVGAATGYANDVAQNLQNENKTLGQALTPGLGTALGTALPLVGAAVSYTKDNLPKWFVQKQMPKLDTNKIGIDETLNKLSYGSVDKNLKQSADKVVKMGTNIDTILSKPENASKVIGADIIDSTLSAFPDSNYTTEHIVREVKDLVPSKGKIIDKIVNGTATPLEANSLKKEIYSKTSKVFENAVTPPARKEIGAIFATTIADKLKNTIDETKPIWEELSKEINLRNALIGTSKKAQSKAGLGLYDIAGYFAGGLPGLVTEKTLNSPGTQLSVAKAVDTIGKSKAIPKVVEATKRLVLKGAAQVNQ